MTTTASVTARMETLLGEAAKPDSQEQILRDYLETAQKEAALIKKVQAQGNQAVASLKQAQQTIESGFFKYVEGLRKKGSDLDVAASGMDALRKRAEMLSPDERGDLEEIFESSFAVEDALYADRIKKLKSALNDVLELFEEYDGSNNEMARHLKAVEGKAKKVKDLLNK